MPRILPLILIAAAALAGGTSAREPKGIPPVTLAGKAQSCVFIPAIRETRVRDDRTIDFVMNGKTSYRNVLPFACPELGAERAFSYQTSLSQLCSTDIITVFRNGAGLHRGASCGLGQFQPVIGLR
ncbi:hypothetical protein [Sphingomonas bacterium]|uniref:hypothetical protein n=1 Tax=Sphingomonas bacterium TaxID=1895847 RepID=UPI001575FCBC|nr:hypothetical protein [Sphingomonas bacterium]